MSCVFENQYTEPDHEYVVISFSIFYQRKYITHQRDRDKDISYIRQVGFLDSLTTNIRLLELGYLPNNWIIRIHYDDSLFDFKYKGKYAWKLFIETYKNNPKVQFVKFKCQKFMKDGTHRNLFGTIVRLYPLFTKNDKIKMIILFDADSLINRYYSGLLEDFEKSEDDFFGISSEFSPQDRAVTFHKKREFYFSMGMIASKVKFEHKYWDLLLNNLIDYKNKDFNNLVSLLDDIHREIIYKNRNNNSLKDFRYGIDEVILNFYITKLLKQNNYKIKVIYHRTNIAPIYGLFEAFLKYYHRNAKDKSGLESFVKDWTRVIPDSGNINGNSFDKNLDIISEHLGKFKYSDHTYTDLFKYYIEPVRKGFPKLDGLVFPMNVVSYFKEYTEKDFNYPTLNNFLPYQPIPKYLL